MSNVGDFEWIWEFWSHVLAAARKLLPWYPIHQNIVIFLVIPRLKYLSAIWLQIISKSQWEDGLWPFFQTRHDWLRGYVVTPRNHVTKLP